jgi:hypothetical protein
MIEKILLPGNMAAFDYPFFPLAYNTREVGKFRRKAQQEMNVIRHQNRKVTEPTFALVITSNRLDDLRANGRKTKLVATFWSRTDRDEIVRLTSDPEGRFVA